MDPDYLQTAKKYVTFMHSYSADPSLETSDDKCSSSDPRFVKKDPVCSPQSKTFVTGNSLLETNHVSGKHCNFHSPVICDIPQEILTCKSPLGNGDSHSEEGICDENSQKENCANNISVNPDFIVEDYGVPQNDLTVVKQVKSSPKYEHSEEFDLIEHVPKNYSNNMDVIIIQKKPIQDPDDLINTEALQKRAEKYKEKRRAKAKLEASMKFLCDVCGKSFKKKAYLYMHSRTHEELSVNDTPIFSNTGTAVPKLKSQYICTVCGSSFVRASNLRRHQMLHTKTRVTPQLKVSPQKNFMLKTVKKRQSTESLEHACSSCGQTFNKKMDLVLHDVRAHGQRKDITAFMKGKADNYLPVPMLMDSGEETDSATEGRMENDQNVMSYGTDDASTDTADEFEDNSSPVKFFSCSQCDLKFLFQHTYVAHMEQHPELEEFECALCHVRFDCTSGLADHFASQCGEKRFRCDVCEQRFARRATLMQHVQTHTKQVAHKCHLCRRPYNYLKYLKNHYVNHHRVEPHQCATCGKLFHTQSRLESHSLLHNHPHLKNGNVSPSNNFKFEDSDSDTCHADTEEVHRVHLKKEKKMYRKRVSFKYEPQYEPQESPSGVNPEDQSNNLCKLPCAPPCLQKPQPRRKSLFLVPSLKPDPEQFEPSEPSVPSQVEVPTPEANDSLDKTDDDSSCQTDSSSRLDQIIHRVKKCLNIPEEPVIKDSTPEDEPPSFDQEASNLSTAAGYENAIEYPSHYFMGMDPLELSNYNDVDSPMSILAQVADSHFEDSRDLYPLTLAPDTVGFTPASEGNVDEPYQQEKECEEEERSLTLDPADVESSESPSLDAPTDHELATLTEEDPANSHLEPEPEKVTPIDSHARLSDLINTLAMRLNQPKTVY